MNLSRYFDTDLFAAQAKLIAGYNDALNEAMGHVQTLTDEAVKLREDNARLRTENDALKLELKGLTTPQEG